MVNDVYSAVTKCISCTRITGEIQNSGSYDYSLRRATSILSPSIYWAPYPTTKAETNKSS